MSNYSEWRRWAIVTLWPTLIAHCTIPKFHLKKETVKKKVIVITPTEGKYLVLFLPWTTLLQNLTTQGVISLLYKISHGGLSSEVGFLSSMPVKRLGNTCSSREGSVFKFLFLWHCKWHQLNRTTVWSSQLFTPTKPVAKSVNKNMDKNLFYHDYFLTSTSGF